MGYKVQYETGEIIEFESEPFQHSDCFLKRILSVSLILDAIPGDFNGHFSGRRDTRNRNDEHHGHLQTGTRQERNR